jgi:hypothetical protein
MLRLMYVLMLPDDDGDNYVFRSPRMMSYSLALIV